MHRASEASGIDAEMIVGSALRGTTLFDCLAPRV